MLEPVSLQTVLTYLTLISVPVGVFYHIMTLRNTRKNQQLILESRQTQLFMEYHIKIMSEPLFSIWHEIFTWEWKDYEDFLEKYGVPWCARAQRVIMISNYVPCKCARKEEEESS